MLIIRSILLILHCVELFGSKCIWDFCSLKVVYSFGYCWTSSDSPICEKKKVDPQILLLVDGVEVGGDDDGGGSEAEEPRDPGEHCPWPNCPNPYDVGWEFVSKGYPGRC